MATLEHFLEVFKMSLISGIIAKISDGKVKTGHFIGKPYKTITLTTGNKLTAFEVEYVEGVEVGKEYTFPVEQSGNYTNIVDDVTPFSDVNADIGEGGDAPEEQVDREVVKPAEEVLPEVHSPMKERTFKNRISAVASAVDFVNSKLGSTAKEKDVTDTAKKFLTFIEEG